VPSHRLPGPLRHEGFRTFACDRKDKCPVISHFWRWTQLQLRRSKRTPRPARQKLGLKVQSEAPSQHSPEASTKAGAGSTHILLRTKSSPLLKMRLKDDCRNDLGFLERQFFLQLRSHIKNYSWSGFRVFLLKLKKPLCRTNSGLTSADQFYCAGDAVKSQSSGLVTTLASLDVPNRVLEPSPASTTTSKAPSTSPSGTKKQDVPSESETFLTITVVGATGELAKSKIFPALFALYYSGNLPEV
jgi:hypothetical protein